MTSYPNAQKAARSAARVLVEQLVVNGVDHVYTVPGESFLPVLDALEDSGITVTVCRQEGGAAMMADAYGRATGRPGICMVTRGPGATNASAGIHISQQDSTPVIMFVGQIERGQRDREAFQEMDYRAAFGRSPNGRRRSRWRSACRNMSRAPSTPRRAAGPAPSSWRCRRTC